MNSAKAYQSQRGVVLVTVLILAMLVGAFCMVSLLISTTESRGTYLSIQRTKAVFIAQSGLEDQIHQLKQIQQAASLANPFGNVDALAGTTVLENVVLSMDNLPMGEYLVRITAVELAGLDGRNITIESTGWVPSASDQNAVGSVVTAVVHMGLGRSPVFDYVYFINNWGWYYGNTIYANGNVRSNGQFDGGKYRSTINGLPRFKTIDGSEFQDKLDEGGLYSGWNAVNCQNIKGIKGNWTQDDVDKGLCDPEDVGQPKYVHSFTDQIEMPNLSDLTIYEELAKSKDSSIKVGNKVVCDGVVGDGKSEKHNLYLYGTKAKPIVLNGPVVVRGNVIIHGYVTGQGCIYAAGNVYVAGNILYKNPPAAFPKNRDKDGMESWLTSSTGADALGLFAREHIVVGKYTDSMWQRYVSRWVNDHRNGSEEDAGEDGIPNTYVGRDGIKGTADDDVLEGDGEWTVQHYTDEHEKKGLLPDGFKVGDVIPGAGEDIDGDGSYDPTTQMKEFNIPKNEFVVNPGHWEGVFPQGRQNKVYKYSQIATSRITRIDGAFYTNHTFAMLTTAWGQSMTFNGCVVGRNEAIVYGTRSLTFNYDIRLLGGGEKFGFHLPKTWQDIEVLVWGVNDAGGQSSLIGVEEAEVDAEPIDILER